MGLFDFVARIYGRGLFESEDADLIKAFMHPVGRTVEEYIKGYNVLNSLNTYKSVHIIGTDNGQVDHLFTTTWFDDLICPEPYKNKKIKKRKDKTITVIDKASGASMPITTDELYI